MADLPRRPSLDGARAKLDYAGEHIGQLRAGIERSTPPVRLREKRELDSARRVLRVAAEIATVPRFPMRWSLEVGDAVQNIRAALDYLAYELIAVETGSYYEMSQFPIAWKAEAHSAREQETIVKLGRHWEIIRRYEPYEGGEPRALVDSLFGHLKTLSNQDKHRLLVPAAAALELNQSLAILMPSGDCRRTTPTTINVGVLKAGSELVAENFLVTGPNPQIYMPETYTPLVCFADIPTVSVTDVLSMTQTRARELIDKFASLF
jgi:hypothetical protein